MTLSKDEKAYNTENDHDGGCRDRSIVIDSSRLPDVEAQYDAPVDEEGPHEERTRRQATPSADRPSPQVAPARPRLMRSMMARGWPASARGWMEFIVLLVGLLYTVVG
jgi:hypothetical protein